VGLVPTISEGGTGYWWWWTVHDSWHAAHDPEHDSQMALASPLDSINMKSGVQGINSLIRPLHGLLRARTIVPFLSIFFPVTLAFLLDKWHVVTIMGSILVVRVRDVAAGHRHPVGLQRRVLRQPGGAELWGLTSWHGS
jgi:hypothetical protein